ncbi:hypothetical protein PG984_007791 [Apiospora sp. TS-2023a]
MSCPAREFGLQKGMVVLAKNILGDRSNGGFCEAPWLYLGFVDAVLYGPFRAGPEPELSLVTRAAQRWTVQPRSTPQGSRTSIDRDFIRNDGGAMAAASRVSHNGLW